MGNIYIAIGEDLVRKNKFVEACVGNINDYNYKKIIVENNKVSSIEDVHEDIFMFFNTFDMFDFREKLLKVYLDNEKQLVKLLELIIDYVDNSILVVDVLKNGNSDLTKSDIYKNNKDYMKIERYDKLKEKDRKEVMGDMKELLKDSGISFENSSVEKFCLDYIFDNSNYSYSVIYKYIEQLLFMDKKVLYSKDIEEFISISFNGNYYTIIDKIWKCKNLFDCVDYLNISLDVFDKSDYIIFVNIFVKVLKDYIRFKNGFKCINGSNYYKFKNAKIKIKNIVMFCIDLEEFSVDIREKDIDLKENLLNIFMKNIE